MSLRNLAAILFAMAIVIGPEAFGRPADKNQWKAVLPEAEFAKLVSGDAKVIQASLEAAEKAPDAAAKKKAITRAKAASMMVAGYAQSAMIGNPAKAGQLAGLRDQAVKLSKAIGSDSAEAKKLADQLSPTSAGVAGAQTDPIDLHKNLDLDTLMSQFKPEPGGGRAMEKKLKTFTGKRSALTADEMKETALLAYQMVVIAQYTDALGPDADAGPKKKSDWTKWSHDMSEYALETAKAAGVAKPDDKTVKAALKKLDESCTKCHKVFRD